MSEMDKERIAEIDNRSRKTEDTVEGLQGVIKELQENLAGIEQATQVLYIQLLTQQIMNEVIPRYMAGYKPGDYIKEIEAAKNEDVKDPTKFKMLVSDPSFDEERFQGLCKEIAQVMINMKAQAVKQQQAQQTPQSPIITPPRQGLSIVKP